MQHHRVPLLFQGDQLKGVRISAACETCDVPEALDAILNQTHLSWKTIGGQYILVDDSPGLATVEGSVRFFSNGAPLSGAEVRLFRQDRPDENPQHLRTSFSQSDGSFSFLGLSPGRYQFEVDATGLELSESPQVLVEQYPVKKIKLLMKVPIIPLEYMVVTPSHYNLNEDESVVRQVLGEEELRYYPHFSNDVNRATEHMPGISGGDSHAGFRIRGSLDNETLVLYDDAEIDEPLHLRQYFGGVTSIFDAQLVEKAELMTGGFSAEYGDRMGGVYKITTRDPVSERSQVGMSGLHVHAQTEGTFANGQGTYQVTGRHGLLDLAFNYVNLAELPNPDISATYNDAHFKLKYILSPEHALSLNGLHARDQMDFYELADAQVPDEFETVDGDTEKNHAWLNWHAQWTPQLSSRTTLQWSDHRADQAAEDAVGLRRFAVRDKRSFSTQLLRQHWEWRPHERMLFHWGGRLRFRDAAYDYANRREDDAEYLNYNLGETNVLKEASGRDLGLYLGGRFQITEPLTLQVSGRYDEQSHTQTNHLSPRAHLAYQVNEHISLRASYGRYFQSQGVHELQVADGETNFFDPQFSEHYLVSYDQLLESGVKFRMEVYLKRFFDLRPRFANYFDSLSPFPETRRDRFSWEPKKGTAQGMELLFVKKQTDKVSWLINYTISTVSDRDGTLRIPRQWDQLHALNLTLNVRTIKNWNIALAWHHHSGWRTTSLTVDQHEPDLFVRGPTFAERMPDYQRMDFRSSWDMRFGGQRELSFYVELMNIFDTKNVRSLTEPDVTFPAFGGPIINFQTERWLRFTPSIGFHWTF